MVELIAHRFMRVRSIDAGCSDARVPANEIVGCGPGELFVHRNIANLVVNNDNSIQSIFQFAVEYLQASFQRLSYI
jgi:carbonic anhydrase